MSYRNLVLRGSILRSTDYVTGIVIYVGEDTKIYLDSKTPSRKQSWLMEQMHRAIITLLVFLLVVNIFVTSAGVYFKYNVKHPYMDDVNEEPDVLGELF